MLHVIIHNMCPLLISTVIIRRHCTGSSPSVEQRSLTSATMWPIALWYSASWRCACQSLSTLVNAVVLSLGSGEQYASVLRNFVKVNEVTDWIPPRQGAPVSFGRSKKKARACHGPGKNHFCSGRVRTENLLIPSVRRSHSNTLLQLLENGVFSVSIYTIKIERPAGGHDNGTPASGYKFCTCQFIFKLI